jgi:DNA-binding MurR/RpiR family transcriptional regulator
MFQIVLGEERLRQDFRFPERARRPPLRSSTVEVASRIGEMSASLTNAERRVAEVVLQQPQLVAFGTVADLAATAGSGAATVVRLASKLGFDGFTALQASVQHDLARQLRPAAVRIREQAAGGAVATHLRLELENVRATLQDAPDDAVQAVVKVLSDVRTPVHVMSGDASRGVARQFADELDALRPGVSLLEGNEVRVRRELGLLRAREVVVALDLRRYDRWVVDGARTARSAGATIVAVSDSLLSPLSAVADHTLVVTAAGAGPFDSHVGTLALFNLVVAGVAERLRSVATERLESAEKAWTAAGALADR